LHKYRTHNCTELNLKNKNEQIILSGWINKKRDHGNLLFIDLRDNFGLTQCVIDKSNKFFKELEKTQLESVIKVQGNVVERTRETINPELKTAFDILDHPELFPYAEDPSKGAFVGCPAGWGCQLANANLFRAFEMEKKGWVLVDPGSAAGLDGSIAKAAEGDKNWFGYYWSPTSIIGKYNMQKVDFGVEFAGKENWDGCVVKPEQECDNPKPSAWTKSEVNTVVTDNFKKTAGKKAMKYLKKRTYPGDVMNAMLVYMADNQADGADTAIEFLKTQESVWTKWVPSSVAKKVKAAL